MILFVESPLPTEHMQDLCDWTHEFAAQMLDDRFPTTVEGMLQVRDAEFASGGLQYFFKSQDGAPLGAVWGTFAGDDMYLGHLVFAREGLTTNDKLMMARIAIAKMFAAGARKIIWQLFSDNRAFRIFLRKLGAEHEGCLKQIVRRQGKLCDTDMMASFPR